MSRAASRGFLPALAGVVTAVLFTLLVLVPVTLRVLADRPRLLTTTVDAASPELGMTITFEDSELSCRGWWHCRWSLTGVSVVPHDRGARLFIGQVEMDLPDIDARGHIDLGQVFIEGLAIDATAQQPPPPPSGKGWLRSIAADDVVVVDASFDAPEDEPLSAVSMKGIGGHLRNVRYEPRTRLLSGRGDLRARAMLFGDAAITDVRLDGLSCVDSTLHGRGLLSLGGNRGTVSGVIAGFDRRATVELALSFHDADLSTMVQAATNGPSPVDGRLSGDFDLRSGGERPRGGSEIRGNVRVDDATAILSDDANLAERAVLSLLPWVTRQGDVVGLGPVHGHLTLTRHGMRLAGLRQDGPRTDRDVLAAGQVGSEGLEVALWLASKRNSRSRLGIVIEGRPGALRVRPARTRELPSGPT